MVICTKFEYEIECFTTWWKHDFNNCIEKQTVVIIIIFCRNVIGKSNYGAKCISQSQWSTKYNRRKICYQWKIQMYIRGERTTNKCCSTLNFSELLYQLLYILCPCFLLHEIFKINWSHGVKILLYNKNKATPCSLRYPII